MYGFRVPLLVVSKYTKQTYPTGPYTGYVSGPLSNPDCSHGNYYCHDFGSILNFIEYVFGKNNGHLGYVGDENYRYADFLVLDTDINHPYSLWDFFDFTQSHGFQTILGAKYRRDCFRDPSLQNCFANPAAADPDDDAIDDQD